MKVEKIVMVVEELEITGATLLSIDEAETLPMRLRKHEFGGGFATCWWWLRSPGDCQSNAAGVDYFGSVDHAGLSVDIDLGAVRPALKISNLKSSNLKIGDVFNFGGKNFEIISDNLAFCIEDVGYHCFRNDYDAVDANVYEKSDVKKFVDDWFENARMDGDK